MRFVAKLALGYTLRHPARTFLTALAIVASVCVVVWSASSYDAVASKFDERAAQSAGRYDLFVVPEDETEPFVDIKLAIQLREDPDVAEVAPMLQTPIEQMIDPNGGGRLGGMMGMVGPGGPGGVRGGLGAGPGGSGQEFSPRPLGERAGAAVPRRIPRMPSAAPTLVGTNADKPPHEVVEGKWIDANNRPTDRGAVIGTATAERLGLKLGDAFVIVIGPKEYHLHVVGLMNEGGASSGMGRGRMRPAGAEKKPKGGVEAGLATSAVYVPLELAKHFTRGKGKINLLCVRLQPESKPRAAEVRRRLAAVVADSRPVASLLGLDDLKANIEESASNTLMQALGTTGLALLASLFIVFTTLSMGVAERTRQFAILRAVGLTRGQVAGLIFADAMLLALIGWVLGLIAGWGLLGALHSWKPDVFPTEPIVGGWCMFFAALAAFGGAALAAVMPAWQATRVQPLEAMSPRRSTRPGMRWVVGLAVAGLILILVNPILIYVAAASISADIIYYVYMAVGCTTMAVGFLLLAPAAILVVESVLGPLVARSLALDPRLLRSQLSCNLWRTLGTTAALTVGLGLYVAMQVWGFSMLEPFKPAAWVPDMLVAVQSGGVPESEIPAIRAIEGIRENQFMPLAVEQPRLAEDITGSESSMKVIAQNNVIMIGLDPKIAFGGEHPMLPVRFVEGSAAEAVEKLKSGRNCIVPDHFLRASKLKLGDRFSMVLPDAPSRRVEYTIVGAVSLPGWHWMTKFTGLRRREGRSAAMVFADYENVKRDFHLNLVNFFWLNVDEDFGAQHLDEVRRADAAQKAEEARLAAERMTTPFRPDSPAPRMIVPQEINARRAAVVAIGNAMRPLIDRHAGERQPVNAQGQWSLGATMFGDSLRVTTPDEVLAFITVRASSMIWQACYLPLVILLVTSLGVVNTVMASVRARQWDFGVLRSLGVTQSALVRIVLAEGIMIGLIACVLSLTFGIVSGWCGTGISQYVSFFGGLAPPLVIPWGQLSLGLGAALSLCLAAALWPAVATGRAEPIALLQAGRAAL